MTRVDKSTKDCAAYNAANADAITAGMLEQWEPNDRIVAEEKRAAAEAKERDEKIAKERAVLEAVLAALPDAIRHRYAITSLRYRGIAITQTDVYGPSIALENKGVSYSPAWRFEVGCGCGQRKFIKLGSQLSITPEIAAKVAAALVKVRAEIEAEKQRTEAVLARRKQDNERYASGSKMVAENEGVFNHLNWTHLGLELVGDKLHATVSLRLTLEQWRRVAAIASEVVA